MEEPHEEGRASHLDPESCADGREAGREAFPLGRGALPHLFRGSEGGRLVSETLRKINLLLLAPAQSGRSVERRPAACDARADYTPRTGEKSASWMDEHRMTLP